MATAEPVGRGEYALGVGRPPLRLDDLPTPEEVFGAPRIGLKETITLVVGPSLIALGLSIGSGEWLLGPQAIGENGWLGIGFVILLSILLQAFYNVEIGRYVLATGEVPSLGFGRFGPGVFGTILAVLLFYLAFITGGWAAGAGDALFTAITGDPPGADDRTTSRWLAVLLMVVVFLITLLGRKISRTLELVNWGLVLFILVSLVIIDVVVVSGSAWLDGLEGLFRPALPPDEVSATDIGGVAGFAAMASGLNYVFMNYYRDKGYGMGSKSGFLPGLLARGDVRPVEPVGTTFRETDRNAALWGRWYRFLLLEMWIIFVPGALIGMFMPGILISHLADKSGKAPTTETIPTYTADQLRATGEGDFLFGWALLLGFLILFTTQIVVFEMLVRNLVDALYGSSAAFRRVIAGDPRRFYYPFMVVLAIVISIIIFQALPTNLVRWAANMSNLAAMIFPFALMYLNSRLPRPARAQGWSYVILLAVAIYFGFFFINFVVSQATGEETDLSFW
ncbi:MAG: Nramp family divalent metal transporter [Actinomycetota bacterium]|nr:Nramp family divalent metal transporter [Actinomycetota bacterium]